LDLIERNFSDKLKDSGDKQNIAFNELSKDINLKIQTAINAISSIEQKMLTFDKSQKYRTIITWVILTAGFAAIILLCKK
jgi:hypothetical protein